MLWICVNWLFFSVCVALVPLWIAWLLSFALNLPAVERAILDGTLFVFAIVRVATIYDKDYEKIVSGYSSRQWVPRIVSILGIIIIVFAIINYTVFFIHKFFPLPTLNQNLAWPFGIGTAAFAAVYALTCRLMSE
jgi:hypothetical protein